MAMSMFVLLNDGAGTLRASDVTVAAARIEAALRAAGHEVEIALAPGSELQSRLDDRLSRDPLPHAVVVGGGDGTVSSTAATLRDTGIALGVLPLGTMNLFARSLGMPLDLDAALSALATARARRVDLGEVNGRVFTHHVSMGLQPQMVAMRKKLNYRSRIGKIFASIRAFLMVLYRPPRLTVRMTLENAAYDLATPALVVTNNLLGANHLPYADELDRGVLGIYICTSHRPADVLQATLEALLGSWQARGRVKTLSAKSTTVERRGRRRRITATVDGELQTFEGPIEMTIRPGCLLVLKAEA